VAIYGIGVPWLAFTYYGGDLNQGIQNGLMPYSCGTR
jgi:hypothetical protein